MKSQINKRQNERSINVCNKLFFLSALIAAASLFATKGYSQVYINAHVGFHVPGARVYVSSGPAYVAPAPPIYQNAPVYNDGYNEAYAPAPVYQDGYAGVGYENEFPGYAYYTYPAWNGHYRDRFYYAHYRPSFEREHYAYFNHGRFDHARFEHERFARGGHYDHGRRY